MDHDQKTPVEPIKSSSSQFAVEYDNQFVVMDDAKHVIGVDGSNGIKIILENVENVKADKFCGSESSYNYISTMVYDKDTGSLYTGDVNGHLKKYKIDKVSKSFQRVKKYGDIGIGVITSSHRFLQFVFFGGSKFRIKVLDLQTSELLPGWLQTSIDLINSLQVCVKRPKEIYLAVSGSFPDYSKNNTDLFDVTGLFPKNSAILRKYFSKNSSNHEDTILPEPTTLEYQQDTTQNLTQERDSNKAKYTEMHSKNNDIREKNDQVHKKNKKKDKKLHEAYETKSTQLHTKYKHNNEMTTKTAKKAIIGKRSFDQIDPLVITKNLEQSTQKQEVEDKSERVRVNRVNLNPAETQGLHLEEIVTQR